ncbi:MAG TPA: amidohydrolase family protein [Steroidobacteraceae bacterium]|nr:amidohydrolase family protein [Steroidobacteraceae bacterium]
MYAIRTILRAGALAALALSQQLAAQELTLTNARIVIGNGQVIDSGSIVVRGGKIASVAAGKPAQTAGRVIDAKGKSVMPGFIDAHRHLTLKPDPKTEMQKLLEAGFTTILSGGGAPEPLVAAHNQIEKGEINGPRLIPSGNVLFLANQTPDAMRAEIRKLAGLGVKYTGEALLTPVPGPTPADMAALSALLDEGAKAGVKVQVHAVSTSAMMAAIDAKVPLLVHLPNKDWITREQAARLAASSTRILSAVGTWAPVFGVFANDNKPRARDGKPWPDAITDGVGGGKEAGYAMVNARTVFDAGAIIGVGIDTNYETRATLATELRAMNGVFSPQDMVKIFGPNSAAYLDMSDQIGTLEAGKQADLVLLDGDPLEGYWNWLKVRTVVKGGKVVVENK